MIGDANVSALPMVIVLHGSGGDEKDLLPNLKRTDASFRYIGFRGPITRGRGYRWAKGSGATTSQAHEHYLENLDEVAFSIAEAVDELVTKYPTTGKPTVFGFSAGAELAMFLAGSYPQNFSAIFAVAGAFPTDTVVDYFERRSGAIVYGYASSEDTLVSVAQTKDALEKLSEFGRATEFTEFDGGHTIPGVALDDLADYLHD